MHDVLQWVFESQGAAVAGDLRGSLAVAAAGLIIFGVCAEVNIGRYWALTAVVGIFAVAAAHCLALLAVRLRPVDLWVQVLAGLNIFILAWIVSMMAWSGSFNHGVVKLVVVLMILVALETLVIPILGRLAKERRVPGPTVLQGAEVLNLVRREDGVYVDGQGRLYEVSELSCHPAEALPAKRGSLPQKPRI